MLAAWRTYLRKYNQGRGVVLIGHSQGSFVLRELIHQDIDPKKKVRKRLVSAILLGGNVTVKTGKTSGVTSSTSPAAARESDRLRHGVLDLQRPGAGQLAFRATLGRAGPGLPTTGDVLCTNPAALGGGSAQLTSVFPSQPFAPGTTIGLATSLVGVPQPAGVTTPWVESPRAMSAQCSADNNAHVLQISPVRGAPVLHAVARCDLGPPPGRREHRARQPD